MRLRLAHFLLVVVPLPPAAMAIEVAVDVGHGVADSGARSARGRSEYEFNREFAGVLAGALRERTILVREVNFDGRIGRLTARPAAAAGSDFFIAIHHDSVERPWLIPWQWEGEPQSYTEVKRGFGLFISARNPDPATSLRCASSIGARLRQAGFVPSDWHARKHLPADAENGVWFYDNLVVLYRTTLPAVLFEAGVIKHRDEELALRDPVRQVSMAEAVVNGIAACLPANDFAPVPGEGKADGVSSAMTDEKTQEMLDDMANEAGSGHR